MSRIQVGCVGFSGDLQAWGVMDRAASDRPPRSARMYHSTVNARLTVDNALLKVSSETGAMNHWAKSVCGTDHICLVRTTSQHVGHQCTNIGITTCT